MHYQDVDTIWLNCLYVFLSLHTDIYFEPEGKMKSTDLRTTLNGRKGRIKVQDSGKESLQRRDIYICRVCMTSFVQYLFFPKGQYWNWDILFQELANIFWE